MAETALADTAKARAVVREHLQPPYNDEMVRAMVSLCESINGPRGDGFKASTPCKYHNAGRYETAADAFLAYNKVKGRVSKVQTALRQAERALYLKGLDKLKAPPKPDDPGPDLPTDPEPVPGPFPRPEKSGPDWIAAALVIGILLAIALLLAGTV